MSNKEKQELQNISKRSQTTDSKSNKTKKRKITMNNKERELALFNLCKSLVDLLGEEQAIADLDFLYERHPEMFKDKEEVREVIKRVVSEPEIAVNANKDNKDYKVIKVAKILNDEKMADVVIKNDKGTNEIFHTNKKRIGEFSRLKNKKNLLQVETPTPSTHQLNGLELTDENLSGANALSTTDKNIIPQNQTDDENTLDSQTIQSFKPDSSLEEQLQILQSNQSKINDMKENFSLSQTLNQTNEKLESAKEIKQPILSQIKLRKYQLKGKTNASIYRRKTRTWQSYR